MQPLSSLLPFATPLLALGAVAHLIAAAWATRGTREAAWRRAAVAAALAALAAALAWPLALMAGPQVAHGLRLDAAGALVGLLVGFIGWVIVQYSQRYLHGEAGERLYLRQLSLVLAAVTLVLAADHLLLLAGAWIGCSLALHRLLCFYDERPAARLAAHKKAISARAADAALLGAVLLLHAGYDTWSLQSLLERAEVQGLPPSAQAALLLLVATVTLKCAQLPLHGWLIQVMEAPTPVSALLHAGVVNLGGLVLIRFAPLLAQAPAALALLATVAVSTVLVATLAQGTRISIKVALAWSTVAQMGFMLLQIALGLPAMALLHLVAHSLYKAHAFLAAGGVVQRQQALRLAPKASAPRLLRWGLAAALLPLLLAGGGSAFGLLTSPAALLAAAVLGLALVPLAAAGRLPAVALVALGWFAGHALTAPFVAPAQFDAPLWLVAAVGLALLALFALHALVLLVPASAAARRLHPWAYAGFHVDPLATRALLALWPLPNQPSARQAATPRAATEGVR
jgi:NAD(P)H-quinone oxidoreductase subunit 5